jgi:hypothetical protein
MDQEYDPFDPINLRADSTFSLDRFVSRHPPTASAKPRARKKSAAGFVVVPTAWLHALDAIPGRHAHRILLRLLERSWERRSVRIKASNKVLSGVGLSRNTKLAVLHRLAAAGIISLDFSQGCAPLVTILYPADHPALRHLHCSGAGTCTAGVQVPAP